jgi:hypothetical protein
MGRLFILCLLAFFWWRGIVCGMWWRQKLGTHVALLLGAIAITVGLVLVRGSVNVWVLPLFWAAIITSIGLICWWLWFLFHY